MRELYTLMEMNSSSQSQLSSFEGDELRDCASTIITQNSFSNDDRVRIGLFYSKLARKLASQNFIVIMSVMALQRDVHLWNKKKYSQFI